VRARLSIAGVLRDSARSRACSMKYSAPRTEPCRKYARPRPKSVCNNPWHTRWVNGYERGDLRSLRLYATANHPWLCCGGKVFSARVSPEKYQPSRTATYLPTMPCRKDWESRKPALVRGGRLNRMLYSTVAVTAAESTTRRAGRPVERDQCETNVCRNIIHL
jgi:hypothetical protein